MIYLEATTTWTLTVERRFSETDLRAMLQEARTCNPDIEPGRWAVEAQHDGELWEIIVEPDEALQLLVVITAYPVY